MNYYMLILTSLFIFSCKEKENISNNINLKQDTIIIKKEHKPKDNFWYNEMYSKSISYYFIVEKDTIDLINVDEYKSDYSVGITHSKWKNNSQATIKNLLNNIEKLIPKMKKDFDISQLNSLYIASPIYYADFSNDLGNEYKNKFGNKNIQYKEFNLFMHQTSFNKRLNTILKQINKKTTNYSMEKLHLIDKKSYLSIYPQTDTTKISDIHINGHGLYISIE